jgi:hypothetical protein
MHPLWPDYIYRTDRELNELAAQGRCFCCKQTGHAWLQCHAHVKRPNGPFPR